MKTRGARFGRLGQFLVAAAVVVAALLLPAVPPGSIAPPAEAAGPASVFGGPGANPYVAFSTNCVHVMCCPPMLCPLPPPSEQLSFNFGTIKPGLSLSTSTADRPPKEELSFNFGTIKPGLSLSTSTADRPPKEELSFNFGTINPGRSPSTTAAVAVATGNFYLGLSSSAIPGKGLPLQLQLSYNSQDPSAGLFGVGWQSNLTMHLTFPAAGQVVVDTEQGRQDLYTLANGIYQPPTGVFATLTQNGDGTFDLRRPDRSLFHFSAAGVLVSAADRNGNALTFSYNATGQLLSVSDSSGRMDTFSYAGTPQPASMTDPLGRVTGFTYNTAGELTAVTDPAGGTTRFAYAAGGMATVTSPRGNVMVSNTYDTTGRVTQQTNAIGGVTSYSYGTGQTTVTDPLGCATVVAYDALFRTTTTTDCLTGGVTTDAYNVYGRLSSVTDQNGNAVTVTTDSSGNPLSWKDALGDSASFTWDGQHDLLTATDPRGNTTTNTYDANGNLLSAKDALGGSTSATYNGAGEPTAVTDPRGNTSTYAYDANGDLTGATNPLGHAWTYSYDAASQLLTASDPLLNKTTYAYDAAGRLSSSVDPLQHTTTYAYDADGDLTSQTDANGHKTAHAYNAMDWPTSATDANGGVTSYGYDAAGNLTAVTDADGHTTAYTHDLLGRLIKVADPLGHDYTYTYDAGGRMLSRTDGNGVITQYTHDAADRLTGITYPTTSVSYAYDADGERTQMVDATGTTAYVHDALGRLVQVTSPGPKTVGYAYDADGNRTLLTYPDGKQVSYVYDAADEQTAQTDWAARTTTYAYDAAGRPTTLTRSNGVVSSDAYDAASRLTGITQPGGNLAYSYDAAGNPLTRGQGAGTDSYSYDALNRLTAVQYAQGDCQNYSYDAVGNRLSLAAANPCGTTPSTTASSYDAADEIQNAGPRPFTFDKNGNQVGTGNDLYVYDAENRLIAIHGQPPNTSGVGSSCLDMNNDGVVNIFDLSAIAAAYGTMRGQAGFRFVADINWDGVINIFDLSGEAGHYRQPCQGFQASYTYNGDGLRVSKTEGGATTSYVWDVAADPPVILQDSGGTTYEYGVRKWIPSNFKIEIAGIAAGVAFGPTETVTIRPEHHDIGSAILQETGGVPSRYLADGSGSTVALTDAAGTITTTYRYDVYGTVRSQTGSPAATFTYDGQQGDANGLLYLRARSYDPRTGRFVTEDPGQRIGGQRFMYANDNPVAYYDATGFLPCARQIFHCKGRPAAPFSFFSGPCIHVTTDGLGYFVCY